MSQLAELHLLFPTVVMKKQLDITFSKDQLDLFKNTKQVKNAKNKSSMDNNILDNECMRNIKDILQQSVQQYFSDIMRSPDDIKPYITQSWLNWTKKDESHHSHIHQNSIISGVFYIETDAEDKIYFNNHVPNTFKIQPTEYNELNSAVWWLETKKMSLLLFPSHLNHEVYVKKNNTTRISLAFNTFVTGYLGAKDQLNYLKL
jgi:hypothetical protein